MRPRDFKLMSLTMQIPEDRMTSDLRFSSCAQNDLNLLFAAIGALPSGSRDFEVVAIRQSLFSL